MQFFSLALILIAPYVITAAFWSADPFTINDLARQSRKAEKQLYCTKMPPNTLISLSVLIKAHWGIIKEYSLFIELEEALMGKRQVESDLKRNLRLLGYMRSSKYAPNIMLIGALTWYWARESRDITSRSIFDSPTLMTAHSIIHRQIEIYELFYWTLANRN